MTNYHWTDNPTKTNVAVYDPDILNECLMHLKYDKHNLSNTYTVLSAHKDTNAQADFINKISDSEINFSVDDGTNYEPLLVSFPNGKIYAITSLENISGLSLNGRYNIFIKENDITQLTGTVTIQGVSYEKHSAIATAAINTITEEYKKPVLPGNNDLHLDISRKPYLPQEYTTSWVEMQFVKLGEVMKVGGALGAPISYALNGFYDSGWFGVTTGSQYYKSHNLGLLYSNKLSHTMSYSYNLSNEAHQSTFYRDVVQNKYVGYSNNGVNTLNSFAFSTGDLVSNNEGPQTNGYYRLKIWRTF